MRILTKKEVLLKQLTENVWIYPQGENLERIEPVVGAIITANQSILIDCGNSPGHARKIQLALNERNAPPVSTIIYTHHHWDRASGKVKSDTNHVSPFKFLYENCYNFWGKYYFSKII